MPSLSNEEKEFILKVVHERVDLLVERCVDKYVKAHIELLLQRGAGDLLQNVALKLLSKGLEEMENAKT